MTLREYMRGRRPKGFRPVPVYSVEGDQLTAYFEGVDCYAENLTPDIVVERAMDDGRIVGVKIRGVRELVRGAVAARADPCRS